MKILLAVDDSPYSKAAQEWVKSMKWPAGTSVSVLTVARPLTVAYSTVEAAGYAYAPQIYEENLKFHEEVAADTQRALTDAGFATSATVAQGDPREAIVEAAAAGRMDLVVVGSHGRTGLQRMLLGSVASYVVSHAPCTVVVVKSSRTT
jgi:nucleotide-binding universal stress UspA family protein